MQTKHKFALSLSFAIAVGGAGCGEPDAADNTLVPVVTDALWTRSDVVKWPNGFIPTCFRAGFNGVQRTKIRVMVEDNWERAAKIEFDGWGDCPNPVPSGTVAVVRDPSLPPTVGGTGSLGKQPSGNAVTFPDGDPAALVVLQEFGHVLGFIHETNNNTCDQRTGGGISLENEFDAAHSVMSAIVNCGAVDHLSSWDIVGARTMYGMKPAGTVAGLGGQSLNVNGGSTAFGAGIIGWPGVGQANEKWTRPGTQLQANFNGVSRCLNIPNGAVGSGFSPLISWSCPDNGSNEQFHFTGVEWRAMGDRCVRAENPAVGSKVSIAVCDGSSLQKWDFFENNKRIRLNGTDFCATMPGGANAPIGTEMVLALCGANPSTDSFFYNNGVIAFDTGVFRCLNVLGGRTTTGSRIGWWNTNSCAQGVFNQSFTLRGQIHALGQCVTMEGSTPFNGVRIGMLPCQNNVQATNEQWEYYW
jgi:hypothetical protein